MRIYPCLSETWSCAFQQRKGPPSEDACGVGHKWPEQASRMEWAEGTAELLHLQRKYFTEQKKERYSFDELW